MDATTRKGKRTGEAAIKIAIDMNQEKLINQEKVIDRILPKNLDEIMHPKVDPNLSINPEAIFARVDFPDPLRPTRQIFFLGTTTKSAPSNLSAFKFETTVVDAIVKGAVPVLTSDCNV